MRGDSFADVSLTNINDLTGWDLPNHVNTNHCDRGDIHSLKIMKQSVLFYPDHIHVHYFP